jgi:hypothetical protein
MPDPTAEGLCYIINTNDTNPNLAQRLSPRQKFDEFINFCKDGVPGENGEFEKDDSGMDKSGVIAWLLTIPIYQANFFATEPSEAGTMFSVTLPRTEVPWITIPGFMDFIIPNPLQGGIGDANGQIRLASITELDDELARRAELILNGPVEDVA